MDDDLTADLPLWDDSKAFALLYLAKTYLLQSEKIADGAYRTVAKANAYFSFSGVV